ncbi:MAG: PaaI family thioesterase [Actinomycetota bacterium]|nr:PaaI family thioesterase [Actinomycetota bacterium]
MTELEQLGNALRELQDLATSTGAPAAVAAAAAASIQEINDQLRPFVGELGTEQSFVNYVATSESHTLNPPLQTLRKGEGFIEMSVRFGPFFRNAFGYVNGGAIALMFDTAIAHVAFASAGRSFTANLNIDYRNPAPIDVELLVKVRLESNEGRKFGIVAELFNGDVLVSEAHSLLIAPKS